MPAVVKSSTPVSLKDEWRTPPELFKLLDHEFHFDLDVAATPENTFCEDFYTKEDDALNQPWGYFKDPQNTKTAIFCNPPFSLKEEFLVKGRQEVAEFGINCIFLVPADATETEWWRNGVLESSYFTENQEVYYSAFQVRFLSPRVNFLNPLGTRVKGVAFPSAVIVMGRYEPSMYHWNWKVAAKRLNIL